MASLNVTGTVDVAEFQEAVVLILRRHNFAPPLIRMAIDH